MNWNINGTVKKQLVKIGDAFYKLANQALYPANWSTNAIAMLEHCRAEEYRIRIRWKNGEVQEGYIRHEIVDEQKVPRIFTYKNSVKAHSLANSVIDVIESSTKKIHIGKYQR